MSALPKSLRQILALTMFAFALMVCWLVLIAPLIGHFTAQMGDIRIKKAALMRYEWLAEQGPEIEALLVDWRNDPSHSYIYSGLSNNQASVQFQTDVTKALSAGSADILSARILPVEQDSDFDQLALRVQFSTDIIGLTSVFNHLHQNQRLIHLENLLIRSSGTVRESGQPGLYIELDAVSYVSKESDNG